MDVVDEDDRVVATVTRRELRARQLLHRCTYVLLRNASGQILVHRRTDTKDIYPGAYDVFSGGVCDWAKPGVKQQAAVSPLTFAAGPGGVPLPPPHEQTSQPG